MKIYSNTKQEFLEHIRLKATFYFCQFLNQIGFVWVASLLNWIIWMKVRLASNFKGVIQNCRPFLDCISRMMKAIRTLFVIR